VTATPEMLERLKRVTACGEGHHEPLEQKAALSGEVTTVRIWLTTAQHDEALVLICCHCRGLYVGHREIGKRTVSEG
ncbi:MAG: hypothetical protein ACREJN_07090, partial [Nitrospiraceae bacterium]